MIRLTARDGHELDAFVAKPSGAARGGLVIAQEMYGVTSYLRDVCTFYASRGYLAIAPALYDRRERNLVFAYEKHAHDLAQSIYMNWNFDLALADLEAAATHVGDAGKVGIVGFCWGGTLAWLAACRGDYAAAVAWYGSMMPDFAGETPKCPVLAIIGDQDATMPPARIASFRAAQPDVPVAMHAGARHGFDNPLRPDRYHPDACALARQQTLDFLAGHVG